MAIDNSSKFIITENRNYKGGQDEPAVEIALKNLATYNTSGIIMTLFPEEGTLQFHIVPRNSESVATQMVKHDLAPHPCPTKEWKYFSPSIHDFFSTDAKNRNYVLPDKQLFVAGQNVFYSCHPAVLIEQMNKTKIMDPTVLKAISLVFTHVIKIAESTNQTFNVEERNRWCKQLHIALDTFFKAIAQPIPFPGR